MVEMLLAVHVLAVDPHIRGTVRGQDESDLLITGGDPMVMKTKHLQEYLEPLAEQGLEHVQTIRIGTKSLTFWPQRYVTDADADDLLALLKMLVEKTLQDQVDAGIRVIQV